MEISAERTAVARAHLPQAELVSCAFEDVSIPKGSMSLVLANPPYFFQDGKRAEYRIIADAGMLLMPGGVMVAIIPAESRRLQGYRYHTPSVSVPGRSLSRVQAGWEQRTPPPELPEIPIPDPYPVPESSVLPQIVVRHADESMLLTALERCGAHLSATWQAATVWEEEGLRESPVMPLSGEAHVAAEVLTGVLDGEIVWGLQASANIEEGISQEAPHLLTAFVGQEWIAGCRSAPSSEGVVASRGKDMII